MKRIKFWFISLKADYKGICIFQIWKLSLRYLKLTSNAIKMLQSWPNTMKKGGKYAWQYFKYSCNVKKKCCYIRNYWCKIQIECSRQQKKKKKLNNAWKNFLWTNNFLPSLQLTLNPDPVGAGERRTAVVRQSNDPVFDEIFAFPLEESDLSDLKMVVQVMDADIMGEDDFIGEVVVEMNTFNFRESPFHTAWYSLNMEVNIESRTPDYIWAQRV